MLLARVWVLVETVGACGGGPYWPAKSQASASRHSHHTLPDAGDIVRVDVSAPPLSPSLPPSVSVCPSHFTSCIFGLSSYLCESFWFLIERKRILFLLSSLYLSLSMFTLQRTLTFFSLLHFASPRGGFLLGNQTSALNHRV